MERFKYTGNHASVVLWGIEFPQSKAVEVSDPFVIAKLAGNSHFVAVKPRARKEDAQDQP